MKGAAGGIIDRWRGCYHLRSTPGAKIGAMNEPILLPRDIAHDARDLRPAARWPCWKRRPRPRAWPIWSARRWSSREARCPARSPTASTVRWCAALSKSAQAALWSMDNTPARWRPPAGTSWRFTSGAAVPLVSRLVHRTAGVDHHHDARRGRRPAARASTCPTSAPARRAWRCSRSVATARDDASETGYYLASRLHHDVMRHLSAELAGRVVTGRDLTLGVAPKEAGKLLAKLVEKVARARVVVTEKPRTGGADRRCRRRCNAEYHVHRLLPGHGAWSLHRAPAGVEVREDVVRTCYDRVGTRCGKDEGWR